MGGPLPPYGEINHSIAPVGELLSFINFWKRMAAVKARTLKAKLF